MKKNFLAIISFIALSSFVLSSCETPVGQGAGIGAATGAIIGGAATGHVWSNHQSVGTIRRGMIVRNNRAILCDPVVRKYSRTPQAAAAEVVLSLSEVFEPQNAPG